jgi:hypothetical protein
MPILRPNSRSLSRKLLAPGIYRLVARRLLGGEGYRRVRRVTRHVLQWAICVLLLEVGLRATICIFSLFGGKAGVSAYAGVAIHTAIAITAMLGFLLSELMDELEFLVKRLAKIRRAFFE